MLIRAYSGRILSFSAASPVQKTSEVHGSANGLTSLKRIVAGKAPRELILLRPRRLPFDRSNISW
ncbi:hypothetical protein AUI07_05240 [archaeon 13_2_20CM_2_53_6]|nr:MAG: hypothetical protein AUI07_05240 [archaeon 13_2_20CM_2_53_6]